MVNKNRIHDTFIVVDQYLWIIGDKISPNSSASFAMVWSPIHGVYWSTTSSCSGFLLSPINL